MAEQIIFYILAAVIVIFSVLSVTSRRILRSATYLLFVLIATGGIYLQLGYEFLAGVQISVYAGGILVLFIFSILLTSHAGDKEKPREWKRVTSALLVALGGGALCLYVILKNVFKAADQIWQQPTMQEVGVTLMGTDKSQYLLPFEAISILLLACIIGGIMIARKR